jgi:hypothetical protein
VDKIDELVEVAGFLDHGGYRYLSKGAKDNADATAGRLSHRCRT